MAEVKWIKITTDMFDNRKIRHLRKLPDGNSIVLIWVMLLTMAGRCNAGGMIFLTENIPYTTKMLADELDFEENTVSLALKSLEQLGMIHSEPLSISNWQEYQNVEGMDKVREQARKRMAEYRERQKLLSETTKSDNVTQRDVTGDTTITHGYAIDIDKDIDREEEYISFNNSTDVELLNDRRTVVLHVVQAWNEIGVSPVKGIGYTTNRGKMLFARLHDYGEAEVLKAIENVKNSAFLKGQNGKGWTITFDWFVKPNNFVKVWEGQYNQERIVQQSENGKPRQESTVDRMARLMREGAFDE